LSFFEVDTWGWENLPEVSVLIGLQSLSVEFAILFALKAFWKDESPKLLFTLNLKN
jgi:hypothetical protein